MRVLSRIGALPNRNIRLLTKLSLMFSLVDSWGGEHVDDDHCLAGRMVGIERGVRCDAFLPHARVTVCPPRPIS